MERYDEGGCGERPMRYEVWMSVVSMIAVASRGDLVMPWLVHGWQSGAEAVLCTESYVASMELPEGLVAQQVNWEEGHRLRRRYDHHHTVTFEALPG